jgi:hypothetical protein
VRILYHVDYQPHEQHRQLSHRRMPVPIHAKKTQCVMVNCTPASCRRRCPPQHIATTETATVAVQSCPSQLLQGDAVYYVHSCTHQTRRHPGIVYNSTLYQSSVTAVVVYCHTVFQRWTLRTANLVLLQLNSFHWPHFHMFGTGTVVPL